MYSENGGLSSPHMGNASTPGVEECIGVDLSLLLSNWMRPAGGGLRSVSGVSERTHIMDKTWPFHTARRKRGKVHMGMAPHGGLRPFHHKPTCIT